MADDPPPEKRPRSNTGNLSPPPSKRQQSATTKKAVANFFTPLSKKEPEKMTWRIVKDTLLVGKYGPSSATGKVAQQKRRIAAFDFDSTLVTSASGKVFSRDASDWKWWHHSVPARLKELHEKDYTIVIISNQGGISLKPDPKTIKSDQKRLSDFKSKVSAVLKQLDLPISLYAATSRDHYRKPRSGMWQELLDDFDLDTADFVDLDKSFFVGDAGGRDAGAGGVVKDHSCVDRDFAANLGISFQTPEEYFLDEEPRPFARTFEPATYIKDQVDKPPPGELSLEANTTFKLPAKPVIVLFCGSPGAGKSSFYWRNLKPIGYARVNQDILKTRDKCLKAATSLLEEGTSVVVDNTNADPETRAVWIKLAQKLHVSIRCVLFTASVKICEHNDTVRALNIGPETNPESRTILPKLAFTSFASRYRKPDLSEGFTDIVTTDFEFEGTEEQKALWSKYWL
ncbi:PNK3P-domain-containing protein [Pyrenochaeta sp. DS3sAY3a]|nr:PNK3P-domain-containing protein [Pyrenochaeta sp. DS3sAY3a]